VRWCRMMPVMSLAPSSRFTGPLIASAGQTVFTTNWPRLGLAVTVWSTPPGGSRTAVTGAILTDVTGGLQVTLPPRVAGDRIEIEGAAVIERAQTYSAGAALNADDLNRDLDRLTAFDQENARKQAALASSVNADLAAMDGRVDTLEANSLTAAQVIAARDAAAASSALATSAANQVAEDRDATAAAAEAAQEAAAQAVLAAGLSGNISYFGTYASALDDLDDLPADRVIQVLVDETRGNTLSFYTKTGGVLTFRLTGSVPGPLIFVDSIIGNDAFDGASALTPLRTLTAAAARATSGSTLRLARGSIWYGESPVFSAATDMTVETYGQGNKPRIDCSVAFSGTWTRPDAIGQPNVWRNTITFPTHTLAGQWGCNLWDQGNTDRDDECGLRTQFSHASQTLAIAAVSSTPGSFFARPVGNTTATNPDTTNPSAVTYEYFVHLRDSGNPNSTGRTLRTSDARVAITYGPGARVSDIVHQRTGSKDNVSVTYSQRATLEVFDRCEFLECNGHAMVVGGATIRGCVARANRARLAQGIRAYGGGFHQYRATGTMGRSRGFMVGGGSVAEGFGISAVYTHTAGVWATDGTGIEHDTFDIDGLTVIDCGHIGHWQTCIRGARWRNVKARGVGRIAELGGGSSLVISDSEIFIDPASTQQTVFATLLAGLAERVTFERSFVMDQRQATLFDTSADPGTDPSLYPTVTLIDSTYLSGGMVNTALNARDSYNITLTRSFFGPVQSRTASGGLFTRGRLIVDANSVLECDAHTPAQLNALHSGVSVNCLTGTVQNSISRTVAAADITYFDSTRLATYPGSGNQITVNSLDARPAFGRQIRVLDAYGAGLHYVGRVTGYDTGNSRLNVTPNPTGPFTSKQLTVGYYNKPFWNVALNGVLATDGVTIRVADLNQLAQIRVGNWLTCAPQSNTVWQAGVEPNRARTGLRRIIAIDQTARTVTINRPLAWFFQTGATDGSFNSLDGTTITDRIPLPAVNLTYFFSTLNFVNVGPVCRVNRVEGGTTTLPYSAFFSGFTATDDVATARRASTGATTGAGYNQIVMGSAAIDIGLTVAEGDVIEYDVPGHFLTMRSESWIVNDPVNEGFPVTNRYHEFSARGVGYKKRALA
jgi:hypothetical protein